MNPQISLRALCIAVCAFLLLSVPVLAQEATEEPFIEATAEPVVEITPELTVEVPVEPTLEVTIEPTIEVTSEPTIEAPAIIDPLGADLFQDDFADGVANGWNLGAGWSIATVESGNVLQASIPGDTATVANLDWPHVLLAASFRVDAGRAGVALRNYTIALQPNGQVELYQGDTLVAQGTPSAAPATWYTLNVQALGTDLIVAVDGVVQFTQPIGEPVGASPITFVSDGAAAIDNVVIHRLDAPVVVTDVPTLAPEISAPPAINGLVESLDVVAGESSVLAFTVADEAGAVDVTADLQTTLGQVAITTTTPVESALPFNTGVELLYTAPVDFAGTDSFTVVATDTSGIAVTATVTVNVTAAPAEIAVSEPLLAETIYTFDDELADWTLRPGWEIKDGSLQAANTPELTETDSVTFSDGVVQARVMAGAASILVRYNPETKDSYSAELYPNGRVVVARSGALMDQTVVSLPAGAWQNLSLAVTGGQVTVSVNGVAALTYNDPSPLPAGQVVLGAPGSSRDENITVPTLLIDEVRIATPPTVQASALPYMGAPAGTANIGNRVWHDQDSDGVQDASEPGIAGVTVSVYRYVSASKSVFVATTVTDANGFYNFNVPANYNYYIYIAQVRGYILTMPDVTSDTLDSDFDVIKRRTPITFLSSGEDDLNWDAGMLVTYDCPISTALDIMIVMDTSGSIAPSDFLLEQNFALGLIDAFEMSNKAVRIGVARFSSDAALETVLTTDRNKAQSAVRVTPHTQGLTNITDGLNIAQNQFNRSGRNLQQVPRAIILITDGENTTGANPIPVATAIKNRGTLIYGIAVGLPNTTEIRAIASDPDGQFVFTVANFTGLIQSLLAVSSSTCNTPVVPYSAPRLTSPANNAPTNDTTPAFAWTMVPFTEARYNGFFQIQIDNDNTFLTPLVTSTVAGPAATAPNVLPDGRYYWRVRGGNSRGVGPWSAPWSFIVDTTPPGIATLKAPLNGSTTPTSRPTFKWNAAPDGNRYRLQVDNDSNFGSPEIDLFPITTLSKALTTSLQQGTQYWRIQATDAAGNTGAWSATWSFNLNILTAPANNAFVISANNAARPAFRWTAVPGVVRYQLEVATSNTFGATTIYSPTMTSVSHTPPALNALRYGVYYWRVNVNLGSGFVPSPFSWRFIVTPPAPVRPVLVAPANGSFTNDNTPTLDWNAVTYPIAGITYEYQVDNVNTFASVDRTGTTANSDATIGTALPDGRWYWRVRAINVYGLTGAWSPVWSINVDTIAPGLATVPVPASGSISSASRPALRWTAALGANRYRLQIDNNSNFSSPEINVFPLTTTRYTLGVSLPQATHFWRIQAVDAAGNVGPWTSGWVVNINIQLTPNNNQAFTSKANVLRPAFSWAAVPGATQYRLEVSTSPTFATLAYAQNLTATKFTVPKTAAGLAPGTYYWRVNVNMGSGFVNTPFYRTFTFTQN